MPVYVAGLDLGQSRDYSALVVVEHLLLAKETPQQVRRYERCDAVHVERFALGTPYPAVVEQVCRTLMTAPLRGQTDLLLDATGVGRGITDLFYEAFREGRIDRPPYPLTITADNKRDLISTLQALVQTERLRFAAGLPQMEQLRKEMLGFTAKISTSGRDSYEALTEAIHDDLVIALAFACWWSPHPDQRRYVSRTGQVFDSMDLSKDPY